MKNIKKTITEQRKYLRYYSDIFIAVCAFITYILKVPILSNFLIGYSLGTYVGYILWKIWDIKLTEKANVEIEKELKIAQENMEKLMKVQKFKKSLEERGFVMMPRPPMKAD